MTEELEKKFGAHIDLHAVAKTCPFNQKTI